MNKDLLTKLPKTEPATTPGGVIRTLDDAELSAVAGGMMARTNSCSIQADDCKD